MLPASLRLGMKPAKGHNAIRLPTPDVINS
jgi:hypothetical protein